MISPTHALSIVRQGQLLALSQSTAYYRPMPVSATELALMRRIDELHLASPFAGAWMLRDLLRQADHAIGRRHRSTLRRLSNPLTTDFYIEPVQEAINRSGKPDIFNTDQGCQFTNLDFTGLLKDHGIQISMDVTDCCRDNVFVKRLWEERQIRGGISARPRWPQRCQEGTGEILCILQSEKTIPST